MNGCSVFGVERLSDTIKIIQNDLFPKAKELNVNTSNYISIILNHSRISDEDKAFLKNGVKWLNEEAVVTQGKKYTQLSAEKRQETLRNIAEKRWGESWINDMMRYIFEAMLGDPIYGGNNKEAGWKWLAYEGGNPRPKELYL